MADLKDNIARYEADVQALKREIAKLPSYGRWRPGRLFPAP